MAWFVIITIVVTIDGGKPYDPFYCKYPSKLCIIILKNAIQGDRRDILYLR